MLALGLCLNFKQAVGSENTYGVFKCFCISVGHTLLFTSLQISDEPDFIPYCKSVYTMLRSLSYPNVIFEKDDILGAITPDVIRDAYNNFLSQQDEQAREKEFKENINELQFLVKSYRNSSEFKKLLESS